MSILRIAALQTFPCKHCFSLSSYDDTSSSQTAGIVAVMMLNKTA